MSRHGSSPRIGLALGSGASRGWSHIGVIKTLVREGIEPDVVCGTSVGALIGAAYLAGNLQKLEEWVRGTTRTDVLKFFDIQLSRVGFVNTERLSDFLHNYVAAEDIRIEALPKPYGAVSTDIETGREFWFTEGGLAEAVSASMALPGLFPAVSRHGRWLVDGGLVNPVPVSTCHALGAEYVIAVNLNADIVGKHADRETEQRSEVSPGLFEKVRETAREYSSSLFSADDEEEEPGLFDLIANSINIFQDRITRSRLAGDPADILISPRLAHIGMLDFHRAAEAIQEGEERLLRVIEDIKEHVQG